MVSDLHIRVDVACNDPDNGDFAGRAAAIQFADALELTAHDMNGPRFRQVGDFITLSRRRFRYDSAKDWYGNWVWNAYWLPIAEAARLLHYVHGLRKFGVDMGTDPLFALWKSDLPWTAAEQDQVRRALIEEAVVRATTCSRR